MKKFINFRTVPFMLLAMLAGIVTVAMSSYIYGIVLGGVAIIFAVITFAVPALRRYKWRVLVLTIALIVAVISTSSTVYVAEQSRGRLPEVNISARISSDTPFGEGGVLTRNYMILDNVEYTSMTREGRLRGKIRLELTDELRLSQLRIGDKITAFGTVTPNRVVVTDGYSMSDYASGIAYSMITDDVKITEENEPNYIDKIRIESKNRLLGYMPSGAGEIMYSMIYGDDSNVDEALLRDFRAIGISHIFAVSGLHVGVLAAAVSWIVSKCRGGKVADFLASVVVSILYGVLTGFGVSVVRAIIMLTVYKVGKLAGYRLSLISSVCVAGVLILAVSPLMLFTLSFQMSMLAIFGMAFFSRAFTKALSRIKIPKRIAELLALSVAVNLALLPIMLSAFGSVSLIFLIVNLLLVPIMVAIFPIMLVLLCLALAWAPLSILLVPIGYVFVLFSMICTFFNSFAFLTISVRFTTVDVILYMLGMVAISPFIMTGKRIKYIMSGAVVVIFISSVLASSYHIFDSGTRVCTACQDKDNNYVMIKHHDEHYLVVGGRLDRFAMSSIAEYMDKYKIARLDGIVKPEITDGEISVLTEYCQAFSPTRIITLSEYCGGEAMLAINYLFGSRPLASYTDGDFSIAVANSDTVYVYQDEVTVAVCEADDNGEIALLPGSGVDILYANGDYDFIPILAPQYYVSDYGVYNNIPYSVASHFTFSIKNGKIKLR